MKLSRKALVRYWLPVLIMLAVIAVESTGYLSAYHTKEAIERLLALIGIDVDFPGMDATNKALRKIGHVVGYSLLSFLVFRAFRGTHRYLHEGYEGWLSSAISGIRREAAISTIWRAQWAMMGWMFATLVAIADEMHQRTIPSRSGTLVDVILDSSAALVVQFAVYYVNTRSVQRLRSLEEQNAASSRRSSL